MLTEAVKEVVGRNNRRWTKETWTQYQKLLQEARELEETLKI